MEDGDSDVEGESLEEGLPDLELDPDSVRVWDLLEEKEGLSVSERLIERLRVRVSVGVAVMEGGTAMVPAKL